MGLSYIHFCSLDVLQTEKEKKQPPKLYSAQDLLSAEIIISILLLLLFCSSSDPGLQYLSTPNHRRRTWRHPQFPALARMPTLLFLSLLRTRPAEPAVHFERRTPVLFQRLSLPPQWMLTHGLHCSAVRHLTSSADERADWPVYLLTYFRC